MYLQYYVFYYNFNVVECCVNVGNCNYVCCVLPLKKGDEMMMTNDFNVCGHILV